MSLALLLEKYDVSTEEGLQKALIEIEKEEVSFDTKHEVFSTYILVGPSLVLHSLLRLVAGLLLVDLCL